MAAPNLSYVDDLREKQIESDFEWKPHNEAVGGDGHRMTSNHFGWILLAMIPIKLALFALGNWIDTVR